MDSSASLPEYVQFDGHLLPVAWLEGDVLAEFLLFLDDAAVAAEEEEPQEVEMEEEEPQEVEFEVDEEEEPQEVEFVTAEDGSDDGGGDLVGDGGLMEDEEDDIYLVDVDFEDDVGFDLVADFEDDVGLDDGDFMDEGDQADFVDDKDQHSDLTADEEEPAQFVPHIAATPAAEERQEDEPVHGSEENSGIDLADDSVDDEEESDFFKAYEEEAEQELALLLPHIMAIPAVMARAAAPPPPVQETKHQFVSGQRGWM